MLQILNQVGVYVITIYIQHMYHIHMTLHGHHNIDVCFPCSS